MPMGLLRLGIVCKVEVSGAGRTLSLLLATLAPRASSAESMQRHFTCLKVVKRALTRRGKHVAKIIDWFCIVFFTFAIFKCSQLFLIESFFRAGDLARFA